MDTADLLVGSIAIVIGIMTVLSAMFNWERAYKLGKVRGIEAKFGRRGARIFYGLLGATLIALGSLIAAGLGPYKSPPQRNNHRPAGKGVSLPGINLHGIA